MYTCSANPHIWRQYSVVTVTVVDKLVGRAIPEMNFGRLSGWLEGEARRSATGKPIRQPVQPEMVYLNAHEQMKLSLLPRLTAVDSAVDSCQSYPNALGYSVQNAVIPIEYASTEASQW